MSEILLLMVILCVAYVFVPTTWFFKADGMEKVEHPSTNLTARTTASAVIIPEDSVLKRHFITQLRSQIQREMYPRPVDPTLRRLYDTMVDDELENLLAGLAA